MATARETEPDDDEIPLDPDGEALAAMAELGHELTPRQIEIAKLLALGKTNSEIARAMKISLKTVDTHRYNVLEAVKVRNNVELARYAIRVGLVSLP